MTWIKRELQRLRQKMVAERRPPEFIARGWALGMFVGCAVPFGLQLCISIPLSFLLKASRVGATVGTLITNPVTVFFIYPAQTWAADKLLGGNLAYSKLSEMEWTFETVRNLGSEIIAAFFLGGLILALVLTPVTYFVVLKTVRRYRTMVKRERTRG